MSRNDSHRPKRRTQIIEVAMTLFATKGFTGTTTRAIAQAADVSEAIIFRHFATKEDLYNAIITYTVEKRSEQWDQDTIPPPKPRNIETPLARLCPDICQSQSQRSDIHTPDDVQRARRSQISRKIFRNLQQPPHAIHSPSHPNGYRSGPVLRD